MTSTLVRELWPRLRKAREPSRAAACPQERELGRDGEGIHLAIIMDGNGRWAQRRGRPRREGPAVVKNWLRTNFSQTQNDPENMVIVRQAISAFKGLLKNQDEVVFRS